MHSKRRYKICMCSVILGELESFRNYNGFRINYYAENFRCNLTLTKVRSFLFSSLYDSFESEKFRFPFSTKNSPTWRVKCEKNKLQKIVWNLLDKLRKMYMNWMGIQKFLAVLKQQRKSRPCLLFRTVVGCPWKK